MLNHDWPMAMLHENPSEVHARADTLDLDWHVACRWYSHILYGYRARKKRTKLICSVFFETVVLSCCPPLSLSCEGWRRNCITRRDFRLIISYDRSKAIIRIKGVIVTKTCYATFSG